MFFPDLSPYAYFPDEPADTVNIGWLDPAHPFETGETDQVFREAPPALQRTGPPDPRPLPLPVLPALPGAERLGRDPRARLRENLRRPHPRA